MAREADDTYDNYFVDDARRNQSDDDHVLGPNNVLGTNGGCTTRLVEANKHYELPSNVRIQRRLPAEPGATHTHMGGAIQQNVTRLDGNAQHPMAEEEQLYDNVMDCAPEHPGQKEDKSKGKVETRKGSDSKKFPVVKTGVVIIGILAASCIALAALFAVSSLRNRELESVHHEAMSNLTAEKSRLTDKLHEAEKRIDANAGCPGFAIDGKCFGLIIIESGGMDYHDAKRVCTYDGVSNIGNIYTLDHFNKLRDHVMKRKEESRRTYIHVWTGMTIDFLHGKVLLTTGAVAAYQGEGNLRKSKEWRTFDARRTNVYIFFWTDGGNHSTNPSGYGNVWPTFIWHAVLCEKSW